METDTKRILLQVIETNKELIEITAELSRGDALIIEALAGRPNREAVFSALEASRATSDSVHALVDRLDRLADQIRRHC